MLLKPHFTCFYISCHLVKAARQANRSFSQEDWCCVLVCSLWSALGVRAWRELYLWLFGLVGSRNATPLRHQSGCSMAVPCVCCVQPWWGIKRHEDGVHQSTPVSSILIENAEMLLTSTGASKVEGESKNGGCRCVSPWKSSYGLLASSRYFMISKWIPFPYD